MDLDLEVIKCNWPYVSLGAIGLGCLIWFAVHYTHSTMHSENPKEMQRIFASLAGRQEPYQSYNPPEADYSLELTTICLQMEIAISEYAFTQLYQMIVTEVIFVLVIQTWFIPHFGGFIIGVIFGAIVIPLITFFISRYVIRMLSQGLFAAGQSKEFILGFILNNGFSLAFLCIASPLLAFVVAWLITEGTR
jgi:hypothetical protein